jgi:hypothetical protein
MKEGKKKIHWVNWEQMCTSKCTGGMGFRDMAAFNQALLARQGWMILTNPETLCSRVLKARYLHSASFLEATKPRKCSYTWRSILHGRELLKEGLVKRIGNGEGTNCWTDPWIPRCTLRHPFGQLSPNNIKWVSELFKVGTVEWNQELINRICFPLDARDILQIKIGEGVGEDFWGWNLTKSGVLLFDQHTIMLEPLTQLMEKGIHLRSRLIVTKAGYGYGMYVPNTNIKFMRGE